jgi:threonine dehydrogenase-like Zn-dependent dehydrogenase
VNTAELEDPVSTLLALTGDRGFDDISVYAPVRSAIELAVQVLGEDGCLNFFAGPTQTDLKAEMNFYNVHYRSTHVVGASGSTTDNMSEYLDLVSTSKLDLAFMISHVGGLEAVAETTLNLPKLPGAKKFIYNHIDLPLTAISDFPKLGEKDQRFGTLAASVAEAGGKWNVEAEQFLLAQF